MHSMHVMQIMNITLTLAINFKTLMGPRKKAGFMALMNSGEFLSGRIMQTMHIMHTMHCMHVVQITHITLTLGINFKNLMAADKKVGCTALLNNDEYLASCMIQTMHIMQIMHSRHVMQIMNIALTLALAIYF